MSSDVPVKIQFVADAGNVQQVAANLQKDLANMAQPREVPKLSLSADVNLEKVRADMAALAQAGDLKLPNLQFQTPQGIQATTAALAQLQAQAKAVAAVQLGQIKRDLDAVLNTPGLQQQQQKYDAIIQRLADWKKANGEVLESSKALQSQLATMTQTASNGLQEVADRSRSLAGIAGNVATAFAGVGTLFGGIAAGSLAIAGNFEQLEARLVSVTGSTALAAEKFKFAQELAAKTPFDVRGLVQGAGILESYKQRAEDFLPVAANLAAAMGKTLPEATLVLAKAASGSTEGFESLRNEYGITTAELIKFGAVQGETANQLSHAGDAIEKNRDALVKIINTRFGDATARQAKTLTGALSNVGDAAQTAAAGFGQGLIPIATLGAKALAFLINVANQVPAPLKFLGVAGALAVAGVAGLGAAAAGSIAALLLLQANLAGTVAQLRQVGIQAPLTSAALQTLTGGINRVAGAMTASRLGMVAFGTGVLAVAAIAATAGLALADSWEKASVKLGDAITDSSRQAAAANSFFRQGIDGLNAAGKEAGVAVSIVGDARQQMEQINQAFATLPKESIVRAFNEVGLSAERLKDQLGQTERGAVVLKERLLTLIRARELFERVNGNLIVPFSPSADQKAAIGALREMGVEVDTLDDAIKGTQSSLNRLGAVGIIASKGLATINEVEPPLKKAAAASEQLGKFIDLTKQVGTTKSLTVGMQALNEQIKVNADQLKNGGDNLDQLLARLRGANGAEKELLLGQIDLIQKRDATMKQIADREAADAKATADAQELAFRRRKALGEANVHSELTFVNERIKAATKGSEEEVALQERKASLTEKIQQDQLKRLQASLQKQLAEGKQAVDDAQAGLSGSTVQEALEKSKKGVDDWAAANKPLLAQFPQIKAELAKFKSDNALAAKKQEATDLKNGLHDMVAGLQTSIAEATGAEQRLAAVSGAITSLQQARNSGLVDEKGATDEINKLTRQKLGLEKEVSREKAQQAISTANLELQGLEGELQVLQARKSAGESVEADITANREDQHRRRLAIILQEKDAAIASGVSRAAAEETAQGKIRAAENQNTLNRLQDGNERLQKAAQRAQALEGLALQGLESEAGVLEARKAAGENVERQITDNLKAQLQERVNLIELERQAALASGQDRVTVEATAQAKLEALRNTEKTRLLKHVQDLDNIKSRVGGANSPIYSDIAEGLGIKFDSFSLGNLKPKIDLPTAKLPAARQSPDGRLRQEVDRQAKARGPGGESAGGGSGGVGGGQGSPTMSLQFHVSLVLDYMPRVEKHFFGLQPGHVPPAVVPERLGPWIRLEWWLLTRETELTVASLAELAGERG